MTFPVDLAGRFRPLVFSPEQAALSAGERAILAANIELVREAIVFMTAFSNRKGMGGHTGGAYDIVPEVLIVEAFMAGDPRVYPVHFDDAGHRVAIQYVLAVLHGQLPAEALLHYREFDSGLPGHPEVGLTPGIEFSSGRLGHLWAFVNGLALAHPGRRFVVYSSDGAMQEGNNAEACRFAVARGLDVTVLVDDNDVTICAKPSECLPGFDIGKTLAGQGMPVDTDDGENLERLHARIHRALFAGGPNALVNRRLMAPGVEGIEGICLGHDAIPHAPARNWLAARGNQAAVELLDGQESLLQTTALPGTSSEYGSNRKVFGTTLCEILTAIPHPDRIERFRVIDSDLAGSCGLAEVEKRFPEIYIQSGIMERQNVAAAAGFGARPGCQGIFGTFAAFQEMLVSELTMARLNHANLLCHFSHSGVDDMSDNTCHFGLNNFFADAALEEEEPPVALYCPADPFQMAAVTRAVFDRPGLRFLYSTRSAVPWILDAAGARFFDPARYSFNDQYDLIRDGGDGYIIAYGEVLYRVLGALALLEERGYHFGLINACRLDRPDEAMLRRAGNAPFLMVFESQNRRSGLGARLGSWLLERDYRPRYRYHGSVRIGACGMGEQMITQGLSPEGIAERILAEVRGARA